jgi:aminopeptidase
VDRVERLAALAVRVGANLQPGQELFILAEPEHAPLVRAVAEAGWQQGARDVHCSYVDEHLRRLHAIHARDELLDRSEPWVLEAIRALEGAALVAIDGDADPHLFDDVDADRAARAEPRKVRKLNGDLINQLAVAWTVIPCATEGWARTLFGEPDVTRLWDEIAAVTRLDASDPVAAWDEHVERLTSRARRLSQLALRAVRFRGPGTDLRVGLLEASEWQAPVTVTTWGQAHVANIPTEEVYTTPDRNATEGVVRLTRPICWYGSVVENASLRFEGGRVVEAAATVGEDFLRSKLAHDEGASYLGEVALVDNESAVGQRGLVYRNGLLDENAASHVALGRAYTEPVPTLSELGDDELVAAGVNFSTMHVDVMIGGSHVDVDGVDAAGAETPILRQGRWVLGDVDQGEDVGRG